MGLLDKLLRAGEGRAVRELEKIAQQVNKFENSISSLDDSALRGKTEEFRERLNKDESLDSLLPEAFAVVREAAKRTLGQRHYDVQLMGGAALHRGNIAEMKTGEGKTLVSTLPAYLNALTGKGVHVVTVNDYLAERDSEWMGRVHRFLGLKVGVILSSMSSAERREAYAADITYGTNNEFGFDYLRDNMAWTLSDCVQREHNFAIVDEVDSILIDEARTPLIISGPADKATKWYVEFANLVARLSKDIHYEVDNKKRTVGILEEGVTRVEEALKIDNLYEAANTPMIGYLNNAIKAKELFKRDKDYVVMNGELLIVDEHTGRMLAGRRYSEGLHQALEAKEKIEIQDENQTLATITLQNYFRLYKKLSGMTGTAMTEASEFMQIYKLGVIPIPTNKSMQRIDQPDLIYKSEVGKFTAVAEDISNRHKKGQPVLVGTVSVEKSEELSGMLKRKGIPHEVLNAKQHEREAHIIEQAGQPNAVTIATNMAGRGTDIVLGGNLEAELAALDEQATQAQKDKIRGAWLDRHNAVVASGGLHVIGSERHESRRIDNQLRGRSGRQGDPGSSRFFLSLEDDLMRIFASERVSGLMQKLGMGNGEAIEHPWVTRSIENAQRKVEAHNFNIRKEILAYDDVANDQRKVIYAQRSEIMAATDISDIVTAIREDVVNNMISLYIPQKTMMEQWNIEGLEEHLSMEFGVEIPVSQMLKVEKNLNEDTLRDRIIAILEENHIQKEEAIGAETLRNAEKTFMLRALDHNWKEHLAAMDYLRQGIHFRGYAQKDPKQEYKREAFEMFTNLLETIKFEVVGLLFKIPSDITAIQDEIDTPAPVKTIVSNNDNLDDHFVALANSEEPTLADQPTSAVNTVGRNEPCPCGSGLRYKQCHGKLD